MSSCHSFHGAEELLSVVRGILSGVENATLIGVFQECMRRFGLCVETEKEYIPWFKRLNLVALMFTQEILSC
jgi:hypothetical protein